MNRFVRLGVTLPLLACALFAGSTRADAQATIHIQKYVDGALATSGTFPMIANWSGSTNNGSGVNVPYSFPRPGTGFETEFASTNSGFTYETHEVTSALGDIRGPADTCAPGKFQLLGYKISSVSFADAATQSLSAAASFAPADTTSDKYVIVWNVRCPTLLVTKTATGGDGTFTFNVSPIPATGDLATGTFNITTTGGTGTAAFYDIPQGNYTITEVADPAWTKTDCPVVNVPASPTTTLTCNVQNTKVSNTVIHIQKYLDGALAAAGTFPMRATWSGASIPDATNVAYSFPRPGTNYETSFTSTTPGFTYSTFEETSAAGPIYGPNDTCPAGQYRLKGYKVSAVSFADAAMQAGFLPGPVIFANVTESKYIIVWNETCTAPTTGTLNVTKNTTGGDDTFTFHISGGGGNFTITTLSGTGLEGLTLAPGTYTITEQALSGWQQQSTTCNNVVVTASTTVSCAIANKKVSALGEIRGRKCEDLTGTGDITPCVPLVGWSIYLDTNNSGTPDGVEPTTVTDANGRYRFNNLPAGTYRVREVPKPGWVQTFPASGKHEFVLASGEVATGKNFGNFHCNTGTISGVVFRDRNDNGVQNANDEGLGGWTIVLTKSGDGSQTTTSNADGSFTFDGLAPGTYTATEVIKAGWFQTTANPAAIVINVGTTVNNVKFGNKRLP